MDDTLDQDAEAAPRTEFIIDQTWRSTKLEELENALNTFVSPQRLAPTSRERPAGGMFGYRGHFDLGIFRLHVESDVEIDQSPEEADDRMAFVVSPSEASQLQINREAFTISQRQGVIFSSGPQRLLTIPKDAEHRVLITSRQKVADCCAKLLGYEPSGFLDFDIGVDLESATGHSWLRLLEYVERELSDPDALIRHSPIAWRQFEQSLLTGLLLSQRHTYSDALLRPQVAAAPFYVKRAEAYIEANYTESLSLADVANYAGVSARSLQNGFQSFRGMTPMAFLRSVRLQHANRALLAADPAIDTVTEIALACGFGHLGEFGALYKRTFGETPRQTLSKAIHR
ncbi:AraC family transcriptional regulator [Microvirga lotononidis]|uniref:DNA-binding domain-containing protein, AraC-type n=1 Tax=Microvirga lotononidis TaxID=864069 RepID=I4YP95_9HYPH|nr:AraC family transcriptional regulator [Microvirga lotononidis]EIM25787.1 DNA-binding domain-containing protein, AraC-type [Microvirga lotononidis]WQO25710.1 AraC family transcriptional regulator [Microvirga lotononidis]